MTPGSRSERPLQETGGRSDGRVRRAPNLSDPFTPQSPNNTSEAVCTDSHCRKQLPFHVLATFSIKMKLSKQIKSEAEYLLVKQVETFCPHKSTKMTIIRLHNSDFYANDFCCHRHNDINKVIFDCDGLLKL